MTPPPLILAFLRHEQDAGGLVYADTIACLRAAATDMGMTYEDARKIYLDWFSGTGHVG